MNKTYALLVGSYFAKPAPTVLKVLASGTEVELVPDPDNPYDAKAVKVVLRNGEMVDWAALLEFEDELAGSGHEPREIKELFLGGEAKGLLLGHVGSSGGKPVAMARKKGFEIVGTEELEGGGFASKAKLIFLGKEILLELERSGTEP